MIGKAINALIVLFLCFVVFGSLYSLWHATVGQVVIWALPLLIMVALMKWWTYKEHRRRKSHEAMTGEKLLVRILFSNSRVFHRSYCMDAVGQESNWIIVHNAQDAISEGYAPCPKCNPM